MFRATVPALVVVLSALALPANALAAQAIRSQETVTRVVCSNLSTEAGLAYVGVTISDLEGSWGEVAYWAAPANPDEDAPTWNGLASSISLSPDGSAVSASFDVFVPDEGGEEPVETEEPEPVPTPSLSPAPTGSPSPAGDPTGPIAIGEGVLEATLVPVGDPETYGSKDRWGNRQYTFSTTSQALAVSGTLSLPHNIGFDLAGCEGSLETYTFFANDPAASVSRFSGIRLSCTWSSETEFVALSAEAFDGGSADLWITDTAGYFAGWGTAVLTGSSFEAGFDLVGLWGEDGDIVGSATASATLARTTRINETESFDGVRYERKGWLLRVDGSMTLDTPAGTRTYSLDGESCSAADIRLTELPGRPVKPVPISNDTPDAAIELAVGEVVTTSTVGAQPDPEAPCLIEDLDGGTYEAPIGATAWYTFVAPGGPTIVDTYKSDFDTVVGVYAVDGVGLVNVACNDDTQDGLEARVTVDTVANATYLIQAGGYGGSSGTLYMSLFQP